MAESKVLTSEELTKLKQFQEQENQLIFDFGRVELQIQSLEIQKDKLLESKGQLEQASAEFGQELSDKYGNGTIDLETGEIK